MDVVVSTMTTVRSEQLRYYRSVRGRDKVCVCLYERSRPPLGPNHPPIQSVPQACLPRDKEVEGMKLNTHLHIVPRLRRSGVTTPHPRTLLWYLEERHLYLFSHGSRALVGHGLIHGVPQSHSDTPHSVRLFRTSDQPVAETST